MGVFPGEKNEEGEWNGAMQRESKRRHLCEERAIGREN
jgi:hypothetical protein